MPLSLQTVKVVLEKDLRSQIGKDGHYFDLVDFSRVRAFQVATDMTIQSFKDKLAEEFGTPVQHQCLWFWARRINGTYRPFKPLSSQEEKLSVGGLLPPSPRIDVEVDLLLEVASELGNPYVGMLFVKASSTPSDILPDLRTLAGFCAHEEIELYEEIKFQPSVMLEEILIDMTFSFLQIENGDIICYQKIPKPGNEYPYPNTKSFFQHVLRQKGAKRKIQALEEEMAESKHQARLKKEEADLECDRVKQQRDNAMRQVNELRALNRQVILEFSLEDLEEATENFSNLCKVGENEYGQLFKGIIHKTMVAIKLSCSQSLFQREVSILRERRHPNTTNLIGLCSEASALVYEWFPNGNLEDCTVSNRTPPLSGCVRAQVIGDICRALLFLHSDNPSAMVHGYLRPCNILIDANYRSKPCNFGMSNLFLDPGTCPPNLTERLPYLDPEFLTTGELTPLSDVYSLGVVILRLLTGMPPLSLAKKVAAALESESLHLLIDKSAGSWPYAQVALLGLSCVEMTREKRPDLLTKVWTVVEPMIMKPPAVSWPYCLSVSGGSCAPAHFFCPIRMDIMKDPQVASDGFTYEGEAIRLWLEKGNSRSPMTNMALPNEYLIPNHALRSSIQEYLQQQLPKGQVDS